MIRCRVAMLSLTALCQYWLVYFAPSQRRLPLKRERLLLCLVGEPCAHCYGNVAFWGKLHTHRGNFIHTRKLYAHTFYDTLSENSVHGYYIAHIDTFYGGGGTLRRKFNILYVHTFWVYFMYPTLDKLCSTTLASASRVRTIS